MGIPSHEREIQSKNKSRVAILIVNGFDRSGRYAAPLPEDSARKHDWIGLCLFQIKRHSQAADPEVLIYDNARWSEQQERILSYTNVHLYSLGHELSHAEGLDFLIEQTSAEIEYLITLDSDSFPIRDNWIAHLIEKLDEGYAIAGVWRDEMLPKLQPFIHPSCLAIRRSDFLALNDISFARGAGVDVGSNITTRTIEQGRKLWKLRRSNQKNVHFLLGGIYGDLIYHQGSGSRFPRFWLPSDPLADERTRTLLQTIAFDNIDRLTTYLRGSADPELDSRFFDPGSQKNQIL